MTENKIAGWALNVCEMEGAAYSDVRVIRKQREFYAQSSGKISALTAEETRGVGIRVLVDGAWGFAAGVDLSKAGVEETARRAVKVGKASALVQPRKVILGYASVVEDSYETPCEIDPFEVSPDRKVALLLEADQAMRRDSRIKSTAGTMEFILRDKYFASSEGSRIHQKIIESGAGMSATAVGDGEVQQRHFPTNLARQQGTGGFELIKDLDLVGNAPRIGEEAVQLLTARPCPEGKLDVIFDPTLLAQVMHEIAGHNTELDRVFGAEIANAGGSFATPDKLGAFRYGSPDVNIYLDSTFPGGLGTFGYDDEGVPAQKTDLIREGILVGYHSSRETAPRIGRESTGCMRADGFNRYPIIRMTNIFLEPGDWPKEELIADTENGLYLCVNKSWSISQMRDRFQYSAEYGYEIKNGKLGPMIKNATFSGNTVDFWRSCDGVADGDSFEVYGLPFCGKGEPWQGGPISHGCSPARFRNLKVGG